MTAVDGRIIFLPRFSSLLTAVTTADFTTTPLDVSNYSGARFMVWRGDSPGELTVYLEESLDGQDWVLGASSPAPYVVSGLKVFNYDFFLRWFRLRLRVTNAANQAIPCWAEGFVFGGIPTGMEPANALQVGGVEGFGPPRDYAAEARQRYMDFLKRNKMLNRITKVKRA